MRYKVTVQKPGWLIGAAFSLLTAGCSRGLVGVTPEGDAARCVSLASEMGVRLQMHPTNHFLLMSTANSESDRATGRFLDQVAERFYGSFGQAGFSLSPPGYKLVCVCLDSYGELDAYGRKADGAEASWMDGYYSYRTNRVAVVRVGGTRRPQGATPLLPPGDGAAYAYSCGEAALRDGLNLTTATHEVAHQLAFNSGLQNPDATYPFWLTEGLAANFEADSSGAYGLAQQTSRYGRRLGDVKARGRLVPLAQFVGMIDAPACDQEIREAYAQAWGLFAYLLQHHREQLKGYLASLGEAPFGYQDSESLRRRFVAAFGAIDLLEKEFASFIGSCAGGSSS